MSKEHGDGHLKTSTTVLDPAMSLVGRLEDLSLGEILQIVSLSKRSGLLRLESPGGKASLYIRVGKVIYAATSEEKEGVLNLMARQGLIGSGEMDLFAEKLDTAPSARAFRGLLEEEAGITPQQFQDILKSRVEELTYALFTWEEGTFSFQLIEDESTHPFLSKVAPFFLEEGIGAQFLVMEGARRKDEMMRDSAPVQTAGKDPLVDPDRVLGGDWEQEFEQHLAASAVDEGEVSTEEDLMDELEEFVVPDVLPPLPGELSNKVVAVGLKAPLLVGITGGLVRAGLELQVHENGAQALTRIQELRQQNEIPYVLVDMEAPGITDGRDLGGLEVIATMWDFGFHLPVGLVCGREIRAELEQKLSGIEGLTILEMVEPLDAGDTERVLETIRAYVLESPGQPGQGRESPEQTARERAEHQKGLRDGSVGQGAAGEGIKDDQGPQYYDIQQEFSEEFSDIDLPLGDDRDSGHSLPRDVSHDPHMARLSYYVNELNRQDISGEITLLALRFASDFVDRAVLFLVRKEDIKGLGQFGVDLGQDSNADSAVRSLNLTIDPDSVFHKVAEQRQSYKGPPTGSTTEQRLIDALGGGRPSEIFLGPIVSMGKVAVLLYGDDYPQCGGLEPTHTLDIFLSHVGLALDRAFLEMRLKSQRS